MQPARIECFVIARVIDFDPLSISPTPTIYTTSPEFLDGPEARHGSTRNPEDSSMNLDDSTRTSSTLLRRTADWRDHVAWQEFVARYEPYIRAWCREYHLEDDLARDVTQIFWMELAEKMRSFRYDPSRRFRGWLRRSFHWRAVDAIRKRGRDHISAQSLEDPSHDPFASLLAAAEQLGGEEEDAPTQRLYLLDLAEQIQAGVRKKVHPQSWQVFWHIAIDGWSTRETADALGISYLAAHAAHKRVAHRLAQEGERHLARMMNEDNDSRALPS
jgi:RNA polymerase sigma factor (sigma-70 family)